MISLHVESMMNKRCFHLKDDKRLFFEIQLNFSHKSVQFSEAHTFSRHTTMFSFRTLDQLLFISPLCAEFFISTKIRQMKAGKNPKTSDLAQFCSDK